jgi:hypothetical protein
MVMVSVIANGNKFSQPTPVIENTKIIEPSLTPTPINTLEPKAALRASIEQVLGSGNRDKPRLTEITYDEPEVGDLSIVWAINDNLTEGLVKIGAKSDATDILRIVAQSGIAFTYVTLSGTFTLVDKFGNVTEENVVTLTFKKETVNKINWVNFLSDNIYDIADMKVIAKAFQD